MNTGWGGGGGGLLTFLLWKGGLIREGGGLIEDLRYCNFKKKLDFNHWASQTCEAWFTLLEASSGGHIMFIDVSIVVISCWKLVWRRPACSSWSNNTNILSNAATSSVNRITVWKSSLQTLFGYVFSSGASESRITAIRHSKNGNTTNTISITIIIDFPKFYTGLTWKFLTNLKKEFWTWLVPVDLLTAWVMSERASIKAKSSNLLPSFRLYIFRTVLRRFLEDLLSGSILILSETWAGKIDKSTIV